MLRLFLCVPNRVQPLHAYYLYRLINLHQHSTTLSEGVPKLPIRSEETLLVSLCGTDASCAPHVVMHFQYSNLNLIACSSVPRV